MTKTSNRFTIFLPDETLNRLDEYCNRFATGTEEYNRSKVISNLIKRFVPDTSSMAS